MKGSLFLLTAWIGILISLSSFSQAPEFLDYQAVIRDYNGEILASQLVGIRIQIKQGTAFGAAVYVETQMAETGSDGLVSLHIGNGTPVMGTFTGIHWENGPYFLQTETDPLGGSDYAIMGISQLLSVPYAQHAKTAERISRLVPETDPVFEGSIASEFDAADTARWNSKLGFEKQGLADVLQRGSDGRGFTVSNIGTPVDYQDAVTKGYVDQAMASAGRIEELLNEAGLHITNQPDSTDHFEKPAVVTREITDIFFRSATGGGIFIPFKGPAITAKGLCWSASPAPDTSDFKTYDGYSGEAFKSYMTALVPGTRYYVRAYAQNRSGISYGEEIEFETPGEPPFGIVTDHEGHLYQTILIGRQEWMAENLVTAFYSNGDPIPNVTDDLEWSYETMGAWCDYKNTPSYSKVYGKLYNGYTVNDPRNVCPAGWRVPSNNDFIVLGDYLGGIQLAGGKLKETGTEHWKSPNNGATNETGFAFLPSPRRFETGSFIFEFNRDTGNLWTTSSSNYTVGWLWYAAYDSKGIWNYSLDLNNGFPVRCIKDY